VDTQAKVQAFLEELGKKHKKELTKEVRERFDLNQDGKISKYEFELGFSKWVSIKIRALLGLPAPSDIVHEHRFIFSKLGDFKDLSFEQAACLTDAQVLNLWAKYDKDGNGKLTKHEARAMSHDILVVLAAEKEALISSMANLFADEDNKEHEPEVKRRVGIFMDLVEKKTNGLASEILGRFDVNKDGKVDKNEFVLHFRVWLSKRLQQLLSPL